MVLEWERQEDPRTLASQTRQISELQQSNDPFSNRQKEKMAPENRSWSWPLAATQVYTHAHTKWMLQVSHFRSKKCMLIALVTSREPHKAPLGQDSNPESSWCPWCSAGVTLSPKVWSRGQECFWCWDSTVPVTWLVSSLCPKHLLRRSESSVGTFCLVSPRGEGFGLGDWSRRMLLGKKRGWI